MRWKYFGPGELHSHVPGSRDARGPVSCSIVSPPLGEGSLQLIIKRHVVASVVLAVCLLTACGRDAGSPAAQEPPLDAAVMSVDPMSIDPKLIDFPLDVYAKNADLHLAPLAIEIVMQECFRRFGLDLPLPQRGTANVWPFPTWDWYGLWDEETARVYGYQSPPLVGRESIVKRVPQEFWPIIRGEVASFNGEDVPEGGCQGEANRALGVEDDAGLAAVDQLQQEAVIRARQHSAVEALIDDWAECLARGGWEFNDPLDPVREWQTLDLGDPGSPAEIELALADIRCKKETGLLRTWVAAEFAYQEILVEENAEALTELSDWRDEMRRKANEIVADS